MADQSLFASNVAEFTVSGLAGAIKRTVEDAFGFVRLRGEISGYRGPHSSGHAYFSLKDERARIDAVVWKGVFSSLKFKPEEGLEVIVTGRVTTFPGKSAYQIVIESLEPAGAGALMALLEERKKKLAAEGLFAPERKRPLPFWPRVVGVVTSPTGAVIRDMLHGFAERCPCHVLLWPVRVQGETCAQEVARAIAGFNRLGHRDDLPRPDLLIVARGGGSLEDLWGFNEEIVARAAAASAIPLISAVGHETDWTLIDLAADARAPTPTKAAEWAVPKRADLLARSFECGGRLTAAIARTLDSHHARLRGAARGLPRPQDLLALPRQRFDAQAGRLARGLVAFAGACRARWERLAGRLRPKLVSDRIARHKDQIEAQRRHAAQAFARVVQGKRMGFERLSGRLRPGLVGLQAERGRERLEALRLRGRQGFAAVLERKRSALDARGQVLRSLSHKSVLERGFALVRDRSGKMVRRVGEAYFAQAIEIEFADGRAFAHIDAKGEGDASPGADARPDRPGKKRTSAARARDSARAKETGRTGGADDTSQGSLF
jgi:exodeoxyribonuclease VII large subunit